MKNKRNQSALFFISAALCIAASVIWILEGRTFMGVLWAVIGCTNLLNGFLRIRKDGGKEDQNGNRGKDADDDD